MKLKELKINHGGKINADISGPFVCVFDQKKVGLTGDEGVGKTKVLEFVEYLVGVIGGEKVLETLKNNISKKIEGSLTFVGNDRANYEIKVTNSQYILLRDGEKQQSPKELLRQVMGPVAASPIELKTADIDEVVKWLASFSTKGAEGFEKEMAKIKTKVKEAKKGRAEANKTAKGIRVQLQDEGYMDSEGNLIEKKWKEGQAMKPVDISKLSAQLDEAGKKSDKYLRAEEKLKGLREDAVSQDNKVKELRKQLKLAEEQLAETFKAIETGEKYLADNKADKVEYDRVKKLYDSAHTDAIAYNKWLEIKRKKKELDEFEDLAQQFDATEKAEIKKQQELQWEVIPDIKGVELVLEDTHEDEGEQKKAGLYYNGMTSRQMSMSEWLTVIFQILKKNKVPMVLLDDTATLGSKFMETLDGLVKSGVYVLYTEMKRGQTTLEIEK